MRVDIKWQLTMFYSVQRGKRKLDPGSKGNADAEDSEDEEDAERMSSDDAWLFPIVRLL